MIKNWTVPFKKFPVKRYLIGTLVSIPLLKLYSYHSRNAFMKKIRERDKEKEI